MSHDDLPRWLRGKASVLAFPFWVAVAAVRGRRRWDVIDCTSYDGWVVSLLPRWCRPKLFTFHSHGLEHIAHDRLIADVADGRQRVSWRYPLYYGSLHLRIVARAARAADACFVLNRHEQSYVVDRLGVPADRTYLAVNGLSPFLVAAAFNAVLSMPDPSRPLNLAFIGTYIERKGVRYLMPAIADYLKRHPAARASLLGTGVDRHAVIVNLPESVRDRVEVRPTFLRDDLPSLLVDYHILIQPSLSEGFSLAGLEGMACGLVPVLTRGHGFEEYATDGTSALLIDAADTGQIVAAIDRLNNSRDEWRRMQSEAVRAATTFTWQRAAAVQLAGYAAATAAQTDVVATS